ncbi:MAG: PmoA family protein [Verrucomicrobiota bacterium]
MRALLFTVITFPFAAWASDPGSISVDKNQRVAYQAAPLSKPQGGAKFQGSHFIHPLKTPSGFTVTCLQPKDHLHHFGLWWPWKFIETGGRKILCWELQKGEGLIQAKSAKPIAHGLETHSIYLDRKAPDGPEVQIHEYTKIITSNPINQPAAGYTLDLIISQETAGEEIITIPAYQYSGFAFRGNAQWKKGTSSILTSTGNDRDTANGTPAAWARVEGNTRKGETAGVLIMSHPENPHFPEKLRTWDKQYRGAVFINFNPVQDQPLSIKPGTPLTRRYRLFIYDGTLSSTEAEDLWKAFASNQLK